MITSKLLEKILLNPARDGCNELKIITGYASPAMVYKHSSLLKESGKENIKITLLLGMISLDGLTIAQHKGFMEATNRNHNFKCKYLPKEYALHSKNYLWLKNNKPQEAFTGSGNYSQNAFITSRHIESFANDTPSEINEFFTELDDKAIDCNAQSVYTAFDFYIEENTRLQRTKYTATTTSSIAMPSLALDVELSLLDSKSKTPRTPEKSGINWGHRESRERNQAYINIPAAIGRTDFFPPRGSHFTVQCDDGFVFDAVRAQDGGKGIETSQSNSILGKYIRKRIGVSAGAYVTAEDLFTYGRSTVKFFKIDDEQYYMDFKA